MIWVAHIEGDGKLWQGAWPDHNNNSKQPIPLSRDIRITNRSQRQETAVNC